MSARPRLVVTEVVPIASNPKPGLRRDPNCRVKPPAHEFAAIEYAIWIGGFVRRRMRTAPGGFVPIALLLAALAGCTNVESPTEPARAHLTITNNEATCAFRIQSDLPLEQPATWAIAQDGVPRWNGTMTTPGLTVGVAAFTGRLDLTVTYLGRTYGSTMGCTFNGPSVASSLVTQ
jgi:hypothetical protein